MTTQRNCTSTSSACPSPRPDPSLPWQHQHEASCAAPPGPEESGQGRPFSGRCTPWGLLSCTLHHGQTPGTGVDSLSSISWSWTELSTCFFLAQFQDQNTWPLTVRKALWMRSRVGQCPAGGAARKSTTRLVSAGRELLFSPVSQAKIPLRTRNFRTFTNRYFGSEGSGGPGQAPSQADGRSHTEPPKKSDGGTNPGQHET